MTTNDSGWRIKVTPEAEKVLRRLPKNLLRRVRVAIRRLASNPTPQNCKTLRGYEDLYPVRVGGWRISYAIEYEALVILILEVAPRGGAYRDL